MNQEDRLLINEGFIFFAFGFALNGYQILACCFAVIAVMTAVCSHSVHVFKRHGTHIIKVFALETVLIHISHLDALIPSVAVLAFASLVSADLWMESSEKAIGRVMKGMMILVIVFMIPALTLKNLYFGTVNSCLITILVFLPSSLEYSLKQYRYRMVRKKHPDGRKSYPAVE